MEVVDNSRLVGMIVSDLNRLVNPMIEYVGVRGSSGYAGSLWESRLSIVSSSLRSVLSRSNFRMMCGKDVYYFTGKIYEMITNPMVIYESLRRHLRDNGVLEVDIMRRFKIILSAFYSQLAIDKELHPKYNIQAYRNGVLNLTTLDFNAFSPEYEVIYLHDYDYNPKAECPLWIAFLRQVLPEDASRAILQMYLGLCTLDRGNMDDKVENCLMLYGTGANGKSVIFETIQGIFGRTNISNASLSALLNGTDSGLRARYYIDGKVINVCPEIQARSFNGMEDAFKSLCSGEPQIARRIGGDIYTMYNVPRLIFNMNNIPTSDDGSLGFFRRFLYLVFDVVIPESMQNTHLADDLRKEYSGILNWIIRGAKLLKKNKYKFPSSDNAARLLLRNIAENNIVLAWYKARKIRTDRNRPNEKGYWVMGQRLLDDVNEFARLNGYESATSIKTFTKKMEELGYALYKQNKKRTNTGMSYFLYGFSEDKIGVDIPLLTDDRFADNYSSDSKDLPYDINDI